MNQPVCLCVISARRIPKSGGYFARKPFRMARAPFTVAAWKMYAWRKCVIYFGTLRQSLGVICLQSGGHHEWRLLLKKVFFFAAIDFENFALHFSEIKILLQNVTNTNKSYVNVDSYEDHQHCNFLALYPLFEVSALCLLHFVPFNL